MMAVDRICIKLDIFIHNMISKLYTQFRSHLQLLLVLKRKDYANWRSTDAVWNVVRQANYLLIEFSGNK